MTTQVLTTRDERARGVLESALLAALRSPAPLHISVAARDNHSGEPAFYVYVEMPAEQDFPDVGAQNRLIVDMLSALERIDDNRFPYLHFGPREDEAGDNDGEDAYEPDEDGT